MNNEKRGMSRALVAVIIIAIVVVIAIVIYSPGKSNANAVNTNSQNQSSQSNQGTLFADSQYANYAYLISGDTLSSDAQTALTGFDLKKTDNADGSTTYDLVATNPEYQTQEYTIQPGQSLYFLEGSLGDDSGGEHMLGDDAAIIVDSNGYIVSGPGPA